jgi:hypothetical protein
MFGADPTYKVVVLQEIHHKKDLGGGRGVLIGVIIHQAQGRK